MKRINMVLKQENMMCGYLYFYVHFVVEIVCFYFLTKVTNNPIVWLVPFLYDAFAFVPQSLLGYISDKYPKFNASLVGMGLLFLGIFLFSFLDISKYIILFIICLGNAFSHVGGAGCTLKNSHGKLSHSAIFVSGGSFGVILGKLLSKTMVPSWCLLILILTTIPFILYADTFNSKKNDCQNFNYVKETVNPLLVIFLAVFVVIIRGYMGYGIPTSWNKTTLQSVYLFFIMGFGKALGGILSDIIGIKKTAMISTIFAIPFLIIGDRLMLVSLLGVMLFSMTMSITLASLVSVLKRTPHLAFGLTTIGLFLGTAPIFFIKIQSDILNMLMIIILSFVCTIILNYILKDVAYD